MDLVEGWPVDYSDSKISFLLRDGNELVMFLNDPIVIKRELVRLKEGHEQILEYEQNQKFYPVPQVFENRTSLGLWFSLIDELSKGPFGYQHIFLTGHDWHAHTISQPLAFQF